MSGPEQDATVTPGQAAYEAFCRLFPYESWGPWEGLEYPDKDDRPDWEEIAQAAIDAKPGSERVAELVTEGNELREELTQVRKFADALERITTAWTRGMYSAWIDCQRGDVKAAAMCLSEGLDGYDGTRWNGTETGEQWWERTKAEEGLTDDPPAVVTAGTEHLAEKIRGLAIPDEETP